ncbi:MAG: N-methyl-L-tryptophan oxidase [Alphaproteobacteria bacterium]|nr:N-methyl-L-tryptophan oxidase [Alphaproteobacteria bacterium]
MPSFDIAVVGLGAVGGAALLAGARAGAKVIGFDRFAPPHALGSTHGETRIVRAATGEGLVYTPFARRSFELWDQLSAETGERLVTRCGLLLLGGILPHAMHAPKDFTETTLAAAGAYAIPHEVLTAGQVRARFPAYAQFDGERAYFEPGAGMAHPERTVAAQLARARALGAQIRLNETVLSIAKDGNGVTIRTATETTHAAHVVLAAGAWTPGFLPPAYANRLTVTRQSLHWFAPPSNASAYEPERMPAFIWDDLYGFPIATPGGGVKIATETLDAVVHPDTVAREITRHDIDIVTPRVRAAFPELGAHLRGATCLYTATPDFNFWVGPHPDIPQATVVSACSGHGFKHAAALGEAVIGKALSIPATTIPASWNSAAPA